MADTTKGLRGLTFEGAIAPNPGLANRLGDLRETGDPRFGRYENEPVRRFRQTMRDVEDEEELLNQMLNWRPSRNERMQSQRLGFLSSEPSEDIGLEAAAAGFGKSRFDRRMTSPAQLEDLEDARAREQSTLGVLGNSIAKMGVLAATTAADSWIGLPAGVINLASEGFSGNINSGRDFLNALVNNPVSAYLQGINEKSEEIFRNYQTAEERNRPWWENMFTANFIGDTLIKNAGFTIGAVVGGKAAVNVLGKLSGAKEARDAFKGLAAELGLAGKSPSEVVELLAKGSTSLEKQAAVKALAESAAKLKNAELGLRLAGGLLAGTGEARIEALNGVSELEKAYESAYGNLDLERAKALMRIQETMRAQGLDINTPEGRAYYDEQKALVDENYLETQEQIAHDKAMAANTIFALNVPLLTAGDMVQWGKLMLGGYAVDRSVVNGIKKVAEKSAVNGALKTPKELIEATKYAVKGNKFTRALDKVGAASRNVFVEMQEEMNQSFFSATAKAKAMGDTTEFLESLYDPKAVADTVSWLDAAKEGMRQSWLNKDDWVEGFAGGFMGFMGLPSISVKVNEKTGKQSPKITMEGGIWSPLREQNELHDRRTELVNTLNNRLASKDFLNYYYGKIGNRHFDSIKEDAVKAGDQNLYKKADHAQLINDAMMFANAGRLQDFIDIIDSFQNVSDDTIGEIKNLFQASDEIQKMTTSGMRTLINDNVDRMKRQLDDYMKIADNIKTVYGNTIDDATVAELTWQTAHLDEMEHDLKTILAHPETATLLSQYRSENTDKTNGLTDYEVVSSSAYSTWLRNKYKDKNDTADKASLEMAIRDAQDASYDMSERGKYIDNISALSTDPELVQKRMTRIKRQQEELRRLAKMVKAAQVMSTTEKLSDFISAMEDLGDNVPDETLADIKKEADKGNVTAKEYLMVRDMDSVMEEHIRRAGEKAGATEEQIKKALDAWNYLKHNSDTAYDLTQKHNPTDVAAEVADEKSISVLNDAIDSVLKSRNLYKKIAKREIKKGEKTEESSKGGTNFKTTDNRLTKKRYQEICEDLQENAGNSSFGASLLRLDLDKANIEFNGLPASGFVYAYYPKNVSFTKEKNPKPILPVLFDSNGDEIAKENVEKLTGPDGMNLTLWINSADFPVGGIRRFSVETPKLASKWESVLPIGNKKATKPTKDSGNNEGGNNPGSKTNPHKFIAPNMDMALLGADSHAVAELLKSLPNDSEVHFGIMEEDGPIYILAGDSNMKIGTLPREDDGSDVYSGLAELESLIRQEFSESSDRRNADGVWVSEKYVNHIREKKDAGFETIPENIPLDEIPGFEGIKEPIIMFVYDEGGEQKQVFSSNDVGPDDVIRHYGRGSSARLTSGFAYLLVPSGNKYIPVMLYTQNVNGESFDLKDPAVPASGFGKRVSDTLDKVVDAILENDSAKRVAGFKKWALNIGKSGREKQGSSPDSLQRLLYFNSKGRNTVQFYIKDTCSQHPEWFEDDDVVMVINQHDDEHKEDDPILIRKGATHADGSEYSVRDQIIDAFDSLEYETESGEKHHGPIAQIHAVHFNEDAKNLQSRIRELVGSKMFLTDVKGFDLTMPSFLLDYWSVAQKKFLRPSHAPVAKPGSGSRVITKKTKAKGTEKIASVQLNGKEIQYNISSGKVKIGDGDWFDRVEHKKEDEVAIKKLGFKDAITFFRTAKALAVIADKYGDDTIGEGRIGNKILLKRFDGNKDAGFVLSNKGGRFMSAEELVEFKAELKSGKKENEKRRKEDERKRVAQAREDLGSADFIDESEFTQEAEDDSAINQAETERLAAVKNVRDAINHLRKNAPQYAPFLDYISKIGYYDEVLVELKKFMDVNNPDIRGRNVMRFRGEAFTNRIVVGRNSFGYQTMMHELVHAFTSVALKYDSELRDNVQTAMDFLQDSVGRKRLVEALGTNGMYAFENPYEFVAEFFSNPKLQELAKSVEMPKTQEEEKPSNIFARIVNYIARAIRSLLKKDTGSFYEQLSGTLYNIVDRQVQLQEEGKMVFKTKDEFDKAKSLASGAKIEGVAFASKIPTVEENFDYRYTRMPDGFDEVLVPSPGLFNGPGKYLTLSQLVNANDYYSSYGGMSRFINSKNLYEFNSNTQSSVLGVRDERSGAFVVVRALLAGDYDALIRTAAESRVPFVIGSTMQDVFFYTQLGFHPVQDVDVDGVVFMANDAFTDEHLFRLGTTYRPFADALDNNGNFVKLRRESYSDDEWNKFSEMEKYHARKCIGI